MAKVPIHGLNFPVMPKKETPVLSYQLDQMWGRRGRKQGEAQNLSALTHLDMDQTLYFLITIQLILKSTNTKILSNYVYIISSNFNYLHLSYIID